MSYGVLNGQTGVNKIALSRTILPISNIVGGSGVAAGATPNTFTVAELSLHQVDLDLQMSSPTNDTPFTLQLWNVTTNTLIQSRNGTAPQQSWASDMYFGFEWNNLSNTDEYAFYIVPNISVALNGYCLLLQDLNFRAVVQEFGGAGVGPGTVGKIAKFTGIGSIGDSIMTEAATTISVAGAVSLAGTDATTFMQFTDGQNVPVSAANQGRIRYNTALQTFQFSENTGAWTDLSGVGPGTVNRLAKFATANTVGDSSVSDTGTDVTQTQTVAVAGSPTAWTLTAAAHTTLAASTEATDVNYDLARTVQWATGDFGIQRAFRIQNPTYAFVGASTISTAATFSIDGPPQNGLNAAITEPLSLWVETGMTRLGGGVTVVGAPSNFITQSIATTGSPTILQVTGAAHTTLTASVEAPDVSFRLARIVQFATGDIATQRAFLVEAPTYAFVGASTITNAATVYITGAPITGANATLTNSYALYSGGLVAGGTGADAEWKFGIAPTAFSKADTAGSDVVIRTRDANSTSTFAVAPTAVLADYTLDGTYGNFTSTGAHGLVAGQTVVIAGFTDNNFNGTFTVYDTPTATTFRVVNALAGVCTVIGTMTATTARNGGSLILQAGVGVSGGIQGTVQCPSAGVVSSTVIGLMATAFVPGTDSVTIGSYARATEANGIAIGAFACAIGSAEGICAGSNSKVDSDYATAIGPYTEGIGLESTALGVGAITNLANTLNIAGLDIVQKYNALKWNALGNNISRPNVIYGEFVDLLATSTVTFTMPVGSHVWIEEVGMIITDLNLDGGALTAQPTCSYGITGNNDKYLAPTLMTLLDAEFTRERFSTLLADVGETSLTMEITLAGTIAGGGAAKSYKGRPYWVVRAVEDE